MLAAGIGLVTTRLYLGRGGALLAVFGYVLIRGFLTVMVGGVWGQTTPHFPLYIVEALLVEAVFARAALRSPVASGALAGGLIGTIGLAAEWGWSHIWMPLPWPESLLPEALIAGFIAAVAAGAVGGFVGGALARPMEMADEVGLPEGPRPRLGRGSRRAALAGLLTLVALIGWGLPISADGPTSAAVRLTDVPSRDGRMVQATIRFSPRDAVDDAHFANVTAWQGGGSVVSKLSEIRPGVYRTKEPVPVHSGWKALLRVHTGDSLVGIPIYLPRDEAIPAPEVPARASFTRPFVRDVEILQREQKEDVPGVLKLIAYLTVGSIAAGLIALIAWALLRLEGAEPRSRRPRARSRTSVRRAELV
jgi:hypothetical protein